METPVETQAEPEDNPVTTDEQTFQILDNDGNPVLLEIVAADQGIFYNHFLPHDADIVETFHTAY